MTQTTAVSQIPFFRYPHLFNQQRDDVLQALVDVMERGAYILQRDLQDFENAVAGFVHARHAIGVANGTDSMLLGLRALGIGAGDEVILPSHTYVATASAVHFVGATPVLVECSPDHLIDPEAVAAAITPRTAGILPVHLNGRTCDMDALQHLATRHGLALVEDAAQALGSQYRGRHAGTFGAWGSFSLYPAKVLGCFGDGGLVTTDDPEVARKVRLLRDHGRDETGEVVTWGLNSRLDNLQAAILNVKLRRFPQEIERRRRIAAMYRERLQDLDDMTLPPGPTGDPDHFDVYQNYEVEAGQRDRLREHLERDGVRTIIQWNGKAVHQFAGLGLGDLHLPRTDRLFRRCFLLPMNTSLTDDEVDYICTSIRRCYGRPA
ncbi:MAG TPA: DegT/DnrJ/EryC1/StrS family aminotransferase [Gemmatimonadales bacterium]|nr:DegT/DnrJ/EryC1/StrS family aminotransferase [Gemmatimonadales bacterium]